MQTLSINIINNTPENITVNDIDMLAISAIVELEENEDGNDYFLSELHKEVHQYATFQETLFVEFVDYTANLGEDELAECCFYDTAPSGMAYKRIDFDRYGLPISQNRDYVDATQAFEENDFSPASQDEDWRNTVEFELYHNYKLDVICETPDAADDEEEALQAIANKKLAGQKIVVVAVEHDRGTMYLLAVRVEA